MRVLHSMSHWLRHTQPWVHAQIQLLPPDRVECHVVCEHLVDPGRFPVQNLHCTLVERPIAARLGIALRAAGLRRNLGHEAALARQFGIQVLHSHFGDIGWRNALVKRAVPLAHVVTFYGFDVNSLPRRPGWAARLKEVFDNADLILCEGPHMRARIIDLGCPEPKVQLHHIGVQLDRLAYRPRRYTPGERLRILIAGRFVEKKGIPYALAALSMLRERLDFELTLVGDAAGDSTEKERIEAAIRQGGLAPRIRRLGFIGYSEMVEEMYRHHLLLSPSVTAADGDTEGGVPVIVTEAAATGMFIVGTRHCDIPHVVVDDVVGLLADERDTEGLADRILEAARRHGRWDEMLRRGRDRIEREFDAKALGLRLADRYEALIGRSAAD